MELWIRSQDKTMLCKPQYIELCCDSELHYGDVNIGYRCVATYKTKERALEVLDEIQKILNLEYTFLQDLSSYVYQMPED
jgi:capsular polysaccharide biosynthesis protein